MGKIKLSPTQLRALKRIVRQPEDRSSFDYGWGSSNINPTLSALEARGLAKCEYDRSKGIVGWPWCRWMPTEMGKDYIAALGHQP